jgi:hypothetical protein
MGRYEDLLEQVAELDSELAKELESFSGSGLRKQLAEAQERAKRAEELEAEVSALKAGPAREKAFREYGIDFNQLSKLERKALESYDGELTPEAIGTFVEENELPVTAAEGGETEEEQSDARRMASQAQRAGTNGGRTPQLSPEDVSSWAADKWVRFAEANPDAAEALRRGETVTGVTG